MNGPTVRLYLDEDVSVLIKQLLAKHGIDALTTVEAGNRKHSDAEQLEFASAQGRAIVTHNHGDFEKLAIEYLADGRHHSGVIIAFRRPPHQIAQRLIALLNNVTADDMRDQVRYI